MQLTIPGAASLRIEFDPQCNTEDVHDRLVLKDGEGRVLATKMGADRPSWATSVIVPGSTLVWRFTSDGTVTAWGYRFTVYPVMATTPSQVDLTDHQLLVCKWTSYILFMCIVFYPYQISRLLGKALQRIE